jgi:hypothetical protein
LVETTTVGGIGVLVGGNEVKVAGIIVAVAPIGVLDGFRVGAKSCTGG